MPVPSVTFSYIESPTLKQTTGALTGADKNSIMQETSGINNKFKTKSIPWERTALNEFLHSPIVFSGHEFTNGVRNRENYKQTNVLVIDMDDDMSPGQAIDKLAKLPGAPLYHLSYSSNHKVTGPFKMHIVMPLSEPIKSQREHELLAEWVLLAFEACDHKVRTDVARGIIRSNPQFQHSIFMGGNEPLSTKRVLDVARIKRLQEQISTNQDKVSKLKKGDSFTFTLHDTIFDENRIEYTVQELIDRLNSNEFHSKSFQYKKIPIFCPICGFDTQVRSEKDPRLLKQNAFIRIGENKLPYINCQSCAARGEGQDKNGSYFLNNQDQASLAQKIHNFFIFRDKLADRWWEVSFSKLQNHIAFFPLNKTSSIEHAYWQHAKVAPPDFKTLPQAEFKLRFDRKELYDFKEGFVNKFFPTKYMKEADELAKLHSGAPAPLPHYTALLIRHISASDEMFEAFLDWLAWIYQRRTKTIVAWLFQGVQGTGKDIFYSHVIQRIFGAKYCAHIDQKRLQSPFNSVLEDNIFIKFNEVQTDFASDDANLIAARIKMAISDTHIEVERKGIDADHGENNSNILFFSNQPNAVRLETSDRRFNVCERQESPLDRQDWIPNKSIEELILRIDEESARFALHLATRDVPEDANKRIIHTRAKDALLLLTKSYTEAFLEKLLPAQVDWEWLLENADSTEARAIASKRDMMPLDSHLRRFITKQEARILYIDIVNGGRGITSQKFTNILVTKGLKSHRISIQGVKYDVVVPINYADEDRVTYGF